MNNTIQDNTNAVWKYNLPLAKGPIYERSIPAGAQLLTVQEQNGDPTIWVQVNPNADELDTRKFKVVGTGHVEIHGNDRYVGTAQTGPFVWHVYEILP